MDFDLSPEHALLRSTIRDFMVKEVAPVVDEHERERRFPTDVVRRLGEMGWLGIPYPGDGGGAGPGKPGEAHRDAGGGGALGLLVAAHTSLGCGPLHLAGTPEQKERFLVPMASGRVIGGYGLTEPGAGSDAGGTRTTAELEPGEDGGAWGPDGGQRLTTNPGPGRDPDAGGTRTPAELEPGEDGGAWVLYGGKRFITNAGQAGTYIITARTGTTNKGDAEINAFIVPADTAGFSIGRLEEK